MTDKQIDARFRDRLLADRAALDSEDALGRDGTRPVELDQQSVGRLARLDAMQHQAMAKATQARRAQLRRKINAALARIDEGEYGFCAECGDEIAEARLDLDPTVARCAACMRG
ncbi:TraR/DksA family transcriptional regulator [Tranquillimonas alkanivorans]|uniref:Transcriptional regulator, TraR/DksA family n=1 Tax=Tranquillimonas alkanivorans TaxID=441119 RepID=A0A1I5MCE8_9RHOB|nr:TraR/DksA C4-type zinc finger protein [Tranquillimonas alkanivorans]SFP07173.1 transcriptional regulator, TraR/DksA family [Tranquillimonas alkanivorans]